MWRVPFKGGAPKPVYAGVEGAGFIAVSRKGHQLAYNKTSDKSYICIGDMPIEENQTVTTKRLIATSQDNWMGQFSHSGRKIAYCSRGSGSAEIWVCNGDGSNPLQLTNFGGPLTGAPTWSADDQYIAFDSRPQGNSDIFIMNADGQQLRRLTTDPADDRIPTWSNDGRWIYFTSNRSGGYQIWKMKLDGGDAIQVSQEEGWYPFESPDSQWLYYYIPEQGDLWRLSLHNGGKQLVLNGIRGYNKDCIGNGIFYLKQSSDGAENDLLFLSFATNSSKKIATIKQKFITYLDISQDRRSVLFHEVLIGDYDIYLVENFQ